MKNKDNDPRSHDLSAALERAEQKLTEREALLTTAFKQAETARSQYEQANERAEALRRRLDAKDEQLSALHDQQISSLQRELQERDELIATLRQLCEENDNALNAINQDAKRQNLSSANDQLTAMGLVLESLDAPGIHHRISRVTTTLGRATTNDIAINSTSASRYHARIVVESDAIYLIDLQSTNGSSVNGRRVSRQAINHLDIVAIGDAKFKLTVGVPSMDGEDRSMDETHALLNDSAIFSTVPKSTLTSAPAHRDHAEAKTK